MAGMSSGTGPAGLVAKQTRVVRLGNGAVHLQPPVLETGASTRSLD